MRHLRRHHGVFVKEARVQGSWYTEVIGPADVTAQRQALLPNWESVCALVRETRKAGRGEIVRIVAPDNVTGAELKALRELGIGPA